MKILSIAVVRKDTAGSCILAAEYDLSSFSFFLRSTYATQSAVCCESRSGQEFLTFSSKAVAERTDKGLRQSVEEADNVAHAYTNLAGLSCVIITDREYPARVAFALINRVLEEFMAEFPRDIWLTSTVKLSLPKLKDMIVKYQNPHEADPIMRVQKELDETKVILHTTMNSLLERGEKLDDLVARSDELGMQSKLFFKSAKKSNSCCIVQ